jgi:hypothetical protein
LTDPTDIANAFNDRYITIGDKTSKTIQHNEEQIEQEPEDQPDHPPFELKHVTTDEVIKTMKKINPNKASDIYKIKPAIIRDLTPFLAPHLTTYFNNAIDEHQYPDSLKTTKVIELYKKKDKTNPANYRPISLLPIIGKVFDTLINNQMMAHLTKHNIISPTQYAFRPNSNTSMALETIINKIHRHTSQRQPILAIFVDLSKAYDTISHKRLLHKLHHNFNFTEQTTTFFSSYLHNRKQQVHTQHATSTMRIITHGVPQGSTLSTTFFLLYINDIIKTTPKSKVYTYADDTTLIITAKNMQDLQQLAQSELNNLISYFHINNLVPNPDKTVYTIFYPHQPPPITLCIGTNTLKHKTSSPLLGLEIQKDRKFTQTVNNIIKKLQPHIYSFRYANKLLPESTMTGLYYSLVYPHLIGNITLWGNKQGNKTYLQPLIRTHKKIIRILANQPPKAHTQPIMTRLKILNITNLYIYRVCLTVHQHHLSNKHPNRPEHDHRYKPASQAHNHRTRFAANKNLYVDRAKNAEHLTRKFTAVWNSLPLPLKNTTAFGPFKSKLRHYLLEAQRPHRYSPR